MNKSKSRILSLTLAMALLLSVVPMMTFAAAGETVSAAQEAENGEGAAPSDDGSIAPIIIDPDELEDGGDGPDAEDESNPAPTATPTSLGYSSIMAFAPLDDAVRWQGFDVGSVTIADIMLPDTLEATGENDAPLTVEGVTWAFLPDEDKGDGETEPAAFDPDTPGIYTFAAELTEGYTLGEGVDMPEITVIVRADGPSIAPMALNELTAGTWTDSGGHRWVEFGGITWRVLEVTGSGNNQTAFLLAEDWVDRRAFHTSANSGDGNWTASDLKDWLNSEGSYSGGGFLDTYFPDPDEQAAILDTAYQLGGTNSHSGYDSTTSSTDKVFLLSVDEAGDTRYFADDADRAMSDYWWLRSPGYFEYFAAIVDDVGSVFSVGYDVDSLYAIRPALKINLSSAIFTSDDPLYEVEITVEDAAPGPIPGAAVAAPGADIFCTDTNGVAQVRLTAGTHTLDITAPGYRSGQVDITVPGQGATVQLTADTENTLPATVGFGTYSGSDIEWNVLAIDETGGKVLLLSSAGLDSMNWAAAITWVTRAGGMFTSNYFDTDENAAIQEAFLLSTEEVRRYLPDASGRILSGNSWWWLRDTATVVNESGTPEVVNAASSQQVRPAMWVDLDYLLGVYDTTKPMVASVVPAHNATGVSVNGDIEITFSERMDTAVGSVSLTGGQYTMDANGSWSDWDTVYTIGYSGLEHGTTYTIGISGFKDLAGNEMDAPTTTYSFTTGAGVDAETPNITSGPQNATYTQNDTPADLTVTAGVSDGGTLSYQWYSNTTNSATGSTAVGTDSSSYTPSTGAVGTLYYYVEVTNTNTDPSITGAQTATATSGVAAVVVNAGSGGGNSGSGGSSGGSSSSGSNGGSNTPDTSPSALTFSGLPDTVRVGDSFTLTPSIDTRSGSDGWTWDTAYFDATFNSPATFTALQEGSTTITYTGLTGSKVELSVTILAAADGTATDTATDTYNPNTGGDMKDNPNTGSNDNPQTGGDTNNPQTADPDRSPWRWLIVLIPAAALTVFSGTMLVRRRLRHSEG
ncbi:MAG: DUF6273 domain-containing protein [Oscillospiraceae bacterium]|nr:DUF6273 domain-containing protein [Oscillospiraceae bacterium]